MLPCCSCEITWRALPQDWAGIMLHLLQQLVVFCEGSHTPIPEVVWTTCLGCLDRAAGSKAAGSIELMGRIMSLLQSLREPVLFVVGMPILVERVMPSTITTGSMCSSAMCPVAPFPSAMVSASWSSGSWRCSCHHMSGWSCNVCCPSVHGL